MVSWHSQVDLGLHNVSMSCKIRAACDSHEPAGPIIHIGQTKAAPPGCECVRTSSESVAAADKCTQVQWLLCLQLYIAKTKLEQSCLSLELVAKTTSLLLL
jgi:hypothetical protein